MPGRRRRRKRAVHEHAERGVAGAEQPAEKGELSCHFEVPHRSQHNRLLGRGSVARDLLNQSIALAAPSVAPAAGAAKLSESVADSTLSMSNMSTNLLPDLPMPVRKFMVT